MYNTAQFNKPEGAHAVVTASDGTQWYQVASGAGAGEFMEVWRKVSCGEFKFMWQSV